MPRRRNNNNLVILDENSIDYEIQEPLRPVKDYLKKQVWELIKAKPDNNRLECSICLDEICCQRCYTILKKVSAG